MKKQYLFSDMLKIPCNSVIHLLVFFKINFNWVLDNGSNLNVKINK